MTRWIAVSSGRVRAKIHPKVAPVCTPACRVITSIYALRLKRWRCVSAGFQLHGPRVNSRALIVPDNHKKFAIAVTRARVDSRVFFYVSLQLSAARISRSVRT
jgi:hypothetical protein